MITKVYDTQNGLSVTPEMGFVKLRSDDGIEYINLSNGDIVEFCAAQILFCKS